MCRDFDLISNILYYESEILGPFSEWGSEQAAAAGEMFVHADTARPHTAVASRQFMEEDR
jgi:hypothetical protein